MREEDPCSLPPLPGQAALAQPERMAEVWNGIRRGERARVARSLPMKMALSDRRLALIPVSAYSDKADEAAYLVHPSSLLDAPLRTVRGHVG